MQVYVGDRRVGEAHVHLRPGQDYVKIPVHTTLDLNEAAPAGLTIKGVSVREVVLPVGPRQIQINDSVEQLAGPKGVDEILAKFGVTRDQCRVSYRMDIAATLYSYDALLISPDQHEEIFDFDWFQPV